MDHFTYYYSDGVRRRAPVADGTKFDGHLFSSHNIVVERIVDPLPDTREELAENNGRHGSSVRLLRMGPRSISLECRLFAGMMNVYDGYGDLGDWYDYDGTLQTIAGFLYTPDERKLVLRNHPGQYYMAHFTSMDEGDRDNKSAGLTLNFTASDPLRYEEAERVLVVQGGTTRTFDVSGTDEAKLRVEVSGVNDSRAPVEFRNLDTGAAYLLVLYESTSANMVTYDCVNHIAILNYDVPQRTGLFLDGRWPILTPGRWTVKPYEGTATLTWRQAWR